MNFNQKYEEEGNLDYCNNWIDMQSEIQAYKELFPKCKYSVIRKFKDGSQGSYCPFGAHGEVTDDNNITTDSTITDRCYHCKYMELRVSKPKTILDEDFEDYMLYIKSKIKVNELKEKFE